MASPVTFRAAVDDDCAGLATLADAATRRLLGWSWSDAATVGQSSFEVGREMIRTDTDSSYHRSNWRVATIEGRMVGATDGYVQTPPPAPASPPFVPLMELKALAVGSWYVSVASVFPEFRGRGIGTALLTEADRLAVAAGVDTVSLMTGSFNTGARRLYERVGFVETARRPFVPFPGSDPDGEWVLLARPIG